MFLPPVLRHQAGGLLVRLSSVFLEDLGDIARAIEHPRDKQRLCCGKVKDEVALKAAHAPEMQMLKARIRRLIASADIRGLRQPGKRLLCCGDKPMCSRRSPVPYIIPDGVPHVLFRGPLDHDAACHALPGVEVGARAASRSRCHHSGVAS